MPSNSYNNNNPMNLVSPKSIQISQPYSNNSNSSSGVTNRTHDTSNELHSPQFDRNLGIKKSPFKQETRSVLDFRSSTNFNTTSNPIIQNVNSNLNNKPASESN